MKTPEQIRLIGHTSEVKVLTRVHDNLYKIDFPENPGMERYTRYVYDFSESGDPVYTAVDPAGGPYLTKDYRIDPQYVVDGFQVIDKRVYVRVRKETLPHYKIHFDPQSIQYQVNEENGTVRCTALVSFDSFGRETVTAVARVSDTDTFDPEIGKKVALSKMQRKAMQMMYKYSCEAINACYERISQYKVTKDLLRINSLHEEKYLEKF